MRKKQLLIKEIVEANAIKLAYTYYLAANTTTKEVENATQVQLNLRTVNVTLRRLYSEFEYLKKRSIDERRKMIEKEVSSVHSLVGNPELQTSNYKKQKSLQTAKAIMLFNTDARFSITE